MQQPLPEVNSYGIASKLYGIFREGIRVRVVRATSEWIWVVTADLSTAGEPLTLFHDQFTPEEVVTVWQHCDGLVSFGM